LPQPPFAQTGLEITLDSPQQTWANRFSGVNRDRGRALAALHSDVRASLPNLFAAKGSQTLKISLPVTTGI
jgi:hypothetical protein